MVVMYLGLEQSRNKATIAFTSKVRKSIADLFKEISGNFKISTDFSIPNIFIFGKHVC